MENTTIQNIEEKIKSNTSLNEENKGELLSQLAKLKTEISKLAETKPNDAQNIIGHIDRSTDEAMKETKDPGLFKKLTDDLSDSVRAFEVSHPKLVEDINYIASSLSNMGI